LAAAEAGGRAAVAGAAGLALLAAGFVSGVVVFAAAPLEEGAPEPEALAAAGLLGVASGFAEAGGLSLGG
jgi:hypothetical protein